MDVLQRFCRNRMALAGLIVIIAIVLMALLAPWLAPHDPNQMNLGFSLKKLGTPGSPLGTDNYGRDILSRLIYGSRISILIAFVAIAIGGLLGTVLGLVAGHFGGWVDSAIMRLMDALFAFPSVLLAIALMTVLGDGIINLIIAISIVNVPNFARIIRGEALAIKKESYIDVVRTLGAGHARIIFRHILPNTIAPLIVYGTMSIAGAILSEAALSFLGLGIQPPTATWGNMLRDGQEFLRIDSTMTLTAGFAILITVLAFNLVGDGFREALDPKLKK
ncbi:MULTISPECIES: ABC transporter permease [Musicola]|uniref:Binding-protein-dependent transport systems inner membrane component n=1 Tax=Musicola paradisiaca (strain Ech703) TaxID=579405 RepID=C6C7G0_MUSP7|nr:MULTISPECIES: ABC transporter permease [Musicola]ACS84078.1 binding-protein-dependent transport systems inner membrane component [Musicola paradisiaca Ech703]